MYYPKSQIQEDLHTNGGELKPFNSNDEYKGNYFKTSNGEFFTGKNPTDKPNIPLDLISPSSNKLSSPSNKINNNTQVNYTSLDSEPLSDNYYVINDSYYSSLKIPLDRGDAPRPPQGTKPQPSIEDYNVGEFERYFIKKDNENKFIETDLKEYKLFQNKSSKVQFNLYTPIKIIWAISGDRTEVFNRNKSISYLQETRNNLFGFSLSFQNKFDKYFNPS